MDIAVAARDEPEDDYLIKNVHYCQLSMLLGRTEPTEDSGPYNRMHSAVLPFPSYLL